MRRGVLVAGVAVLTLLPVLPAVAGAGSPPASGPAGPVARVAAGPLPTLEPVLPSPSPSASPTPSPRPSPTRSAAPGVPPQDRWALLVGVTEYRSPVRNTVGGAADARLARDVLLRNGWRSDHIRLLTDGAATGAALRDGLAWLAARSGPDTFVLLHYSGHVKQRDGHEYLWPVDNAFLSDSELVAAVREVRGRSWTSISGCEAAGFDDGLSSPQRLFTGSSAADEKSYEDPEWGTSVWAGLLWDQGLRGGAGDADGDGRVSVQEATRWAAPRAAAITDRQRPYGPQHPVLRGGGPPVYLDAP